MYGKPIILPLATRVVGRDSATILLLFPLISNSCFVLLALIRVPMNSHILGLPVMSWNIWGLGDSDKCIVVRDALSLARPIIVCIQESKLRSINVFSSRSFLPRNVTNFESIHTDGSYGGIITA
jgi:hypothetical protein